MARVKLYCITAKRSDVGYEQQAEAACAGGADALLFHDPEMTAREILAVGARLKEICAAYDTVFLVNGRPDLALALDAGGVHLGPDDITVSWARQILGGRKTVGYSVNSLGQAMTGAKEGASYITVGPLYAGAKHAAEDVSGLDLIRMVKERVKVPVIAIGGINAGNAAEVIGAGADGVAVLRAVCGAKDIKAAAQDLKETMQRASEGKAS